MADRGVGEVEPVVKCWTCGTETAWGAVCGECGRPQPFSPGSNHWAVLGLEMRLVLDLADLEARFHALSRRFHPDYFRLRSPEEQAISLENSAAVNAAYRTLRDPVRRVEYLLEAEGMALGAAGQTRPPADLFEEILELQEARQALAGASPAEGAAVRARLEMARTDFAARLAEAERDLVGLLPRWEEADAEKRRGLLGEMRDLLALRAYLKTVLGDLDATLDRAN